MNAVCVLAASKLPTSVWGIERGSFFEACMKVVSIEVESRVPWVALCLSSVSVERASESSKSGLLMYSSWLHHLLRMSYIFLFCQ